MRDSSTMTVLSLVRRLRYGCQEGRLGSAAALVAAKALKTEMEREMA